jgi:hypothetical protein
MLRYLPVLLVLALWIYTFIDCLNTPEKEVRNLPKLAWIAIIVLFGTMLFGPVAWLIAGRPRGRSALGSGGGRGPEGPRRGRSRRDQWVAPDDNPDFLRSLDEDKKPDDPGPDDPKG